MEKINVCADKIQMVRVRGERRDRITISQHKSKPNKAAKYIFPDSNNCYHMFISYL